MKYTANKQGWSLTFVKDHECVTMLTSCIFTDSDLPYILSQILLLPCVSVS